MQRAMFVQWMKIQGSVPEPLIQTARPCSVKDETPH
jgi:hypothetical protein